MAQTSRQERERARIRRATAAAEAAKKSALDVALAQIGAAFDETAVVCNFKIRIEHLLQLGPQHPAVRARFGARADMLSGRSLDAAVITAERWWRHERNAFQLASALGRGNRISVEVLRELRLILRLLRFKRMEADYGAAIVALRGTIFAVAAE